MPESPIAEPTPPICLARDGAAWTALALTTALTVWRAAPAGSWLDSGELIAAARTLGGIHPPGHPAWLSLAGFAELLPIGPYSARIAWLSAIFAGIAALFAVRLGRAALQATGSGANRPWLALTAAAPLVASASLWQVAVRAEVYTLALATILWSLDAALRARSAAGRSDLAKVRGAATQVAVAVSLGLLNHHYISVFALPAVLWAGWPALRILAAQSRYFVGILCAFGLWLGSAYVALTLRALADVELRWGDPASIVGLWDTVSARHFQKSVSAAQVDVVDNLMLLLAMVSSTTGPWLSGVAAVGLVAGMVKRAPVAWAASLLVVGALVTKALMQVDINNPDDHGYVLAALGGMAIGVTLFVGYVVQNLSNRLAILAVCGTLAVLTGYQVTHTAGQATCNLADLRATDTTDSLARRAVAPGSLVLTNYYGVQFNEAAFRLAEGRRPDWQVTHLSLRTGDTDGGAAYAQWLGKRYPQLAVLGQASQHFARPPIGNVLVMVEEQPVFAEADPNNLIPAQYWGFDGLFARLLIDRERALDYDVEALRVRRDQVWQRHYDRMTETDRADHSTRMVLLWNHAMQAAHALRRGWRQVAADEVTRARAIAPTDRLVSRLAQRVAALDAAWTRADAKGFAATWQRFGTYDFDMLAGDAP